MSSRTCGRVRGDATDRAGTRPGVGVVVQPAGEEGTHVGEVFGVGGQCFERAPAGGCRMQVRDAGQQSGPLLRLPPVMASRMAVRLRRQSVSPARL